MALGTLKTALILGALGIVGTLAACTSSADDGDGNNSSSSGSTDTDGGSSGNGSSSGEGGSSGASGGSSGTVETKTGTITLVEISDTVASASAFFSQGGTASEGPDADCTKREEGSCSVVVCNYGPTPDAGTVEDAGTPPAAPHAGVITINGGTEITLTPDEATGLYPTLTAPALTNIWDTADIAVSAAGATVPAFADSLAPPAAITFTAPALDFVTPLAIDKANDLAVTWDNGAAGTKVSFLLATTKPGVKSAMITCSFDAAGGTGSVPKGALADLLPTSDGVNGTGTLGVSTGKEITAGDWKVLVNAAGPGGFGTISVAE